MKGSQALGLINYLNKRKDLKGWKSVGSIEAKDILTNSNYLRDKNGTIRKVK